MNFETEKIKKAPSQSESTLSVRNTYCPVWNKEAHHRL